MCPRDFLLELAYATIILQKQASSWKMTLWVKSLKIWKHFHFFVLQATFSAKLIYQKLNSLALDMHILSAHVYVLEQDLPLFLIPFFGGGKFMQRGFHFPQGRL